MALILAMLIIFATMCISLMGMVKRRNQKRVLFLLIPFFISFIVLVFIGYMMLYNKLYFLF
ncbi:hypothetical protein [Pseudalkalibacillus caeni]|uniref:Uncharacterized protein n=1 Tax=Exobacillus caeni TaxID=2574798 RepID=A0A5R9F8U0_9BACL|nr:hypothetical protein [Pseudalkalibacillus caeni]TLS37263.1 hypothetical protein FCL54_12125 [Pseudalkalibacillus caeni]